MPEYTKSILTTCYLAAVGFISLFSMFSLIFWGALVQEGKFNDFHILKFSVYENIFLLLLLLFVISGILGWWSYLRAKITKCQVCGGTPLINQGPQGKHLNIGAIVKVVFGKEICNHNED